MGDIFLIQKQILNTIFDSVLIQQAEEKAQSLQFCCCIIWFGQKGCVCTSEGCDNSSSFGLNTQTLKQLGCPHHPNPPPTPDKNHLLSPLVWASEAATANTDSHLTLGARIEFPLEPCIFNHHRPFHTYTNTYRSTSSRGVGHLNKQMCGNKQS